MRPLVMSVVLLAATVTALPSQAQSAPAATPCASPEHRQFDFWVGEWTVTRPDGGPAGTSRIESVLGGCALLEHWEAAKGGAGKSLTLYVAADREWNQTWVDAQGNRIVLTGGWDGTRMVLRNAWTGAKGEAMRSELSWTPSADGRVRQVWRQSSDDGTTWTTTFDGTYTRTAR
ncbi:MAG: hypothetical protein R2708_11990 [Vicinamibacterales bacterium]